MGGSLANLPADRIAQVELLENKNCHNSQFSTAKEKASRSQPDFSASLLDQSELTEKPNKSGQDLYSAAELPPSCFEVAEELPNNSGQGKYSAAESQPVEVEVTAFESYTPLSKQSVVTNLGQPSFGQQRSTTTGSQNENRASRHQPHLPKNLDGSDRLPWDTEKRGVFDPQFENWMARSLMQYPAYRDLMAGELMTKVRKHISGGRYDLKRCDELLIEWSAMLEHQNADEFTTSKSTLTAKGAARRAKIARALGMEVC